MIWIVHYMWEAVVLQKYRISPDSTWQCVVPRVGLPCFSGQMMDGVEDVMSHQLTDDLPTQTLAAHSPGIKLTAGKLLPADLLHTSSALMANGHGKTKSNQDESPIDL